METTFEQLLRNLENSVLAFSRAATIEECQAFAENVHTARQAIIDRVTSLVEAAKKEGGENG